jgi:hypothetical protein
MIWKLLRAHISIAQFVGFFLANLCGMVIVLLGIQFYNDVLPVFTQEDSFMKADYVMVSKQIGMGTTISGANTDFTKNDIEDVASQPFVMKVCGFTSTNYKVDAHMGISGQPVLSSELFFESVPDDFVEIDKSQWQWKEGQKEVPVIVPRTYINMYNFGYAQSHNAPKISESVMGMIDFAIVIKGDGKEDTYNGRVVGFSSSLSSILVPQSFMDWSNSYYAPKDEVSHTRLLMQVTNATDKNVSQYLEDHGMEIEQDQMNQEKIAYFLRLVVSLVLIVGLVISALSFYILMLSIYLLVQKNAKKLENLLLIGYSPSRVARPYQLLTASLNLIVLVIAIVVVLIVRSYYITMIEDIYPELASGSLIPMIMVGVALFLIVTFVNLFVIRSKIIRIWYRKD